MNYDKYTATIYVKDEPELMYEAKSGSYVAGYAEVYAAIDRRITVGDNIQYAPYELGSTNERVERLAKKLER